MKRTKLVRRKPLRSGSVLPKRNRKRANARRERDFGPFGFGYWVRQQRCVTKAETCWLYPVDVAHVRSRGAGGTWQSNVVPLCRYHHDEQHRIGIRSFQAKYKIDLAGVASALAARYAEEMGTE